MGLNVPTKISDYFWWRIWSRKLEEAIIAPPLVWLEGQVRLQQMLWGWTAAITSIGQQNTKIISSVTFVLRGASERPPYINVPNVMWVCAWCHVSPIITKKQICKLVSLQLACLCECACACVRCVGTEELLKVPRNFCSSQNYVSNKIFTLHFIYCMK